MFYFWLVLDIIFWLAFVHSFEVGGLMIDEYHAGGSLDALEALSSDHFCQGNPF